MGMWLKQSTASQEVLLGPFVDSTDGNTAETALTIANTDIKIWKEGATTLADKNSGGATHISNGYYYAVLDATDTDTLGKLEVNVKVSGALAVRREFMVLPANVYDSLVSGTDVLNADVTQFGGTNGTFSGGRPEVNATHWGGTAIASATVRADLINIAGVAVSTTTAQLGVNVVQVSGDSAAADNLEAATDGTGYNIGGGQVVAASVTGAVGSVTGNVGGNLNGNVASVTSVGAGAITSSSFAASSITATAIATSAFTGAKFANDSLTAAALASDAIAEIADAVWDEAISGHLTAGSTGNALNAAGSAGDPWSTGLPGAYGAGSAGYILGTNLNATVSSRASQTSLDTLDDYVDTEVAAIKAKTDNLPAAPAATGDIPSAATIADAVWDEATSGHVTAGTFGEQLKTDVDAILADTNELQTDWTNGGRLDLIVDAILDDTGTSGVLLTSAYDFAKGTVAVTESYNTDGAAPTPVQALMLILQSLTEVSISGTTMTIKKLDGSTTAATLTLNSGTTPTAKTRAS